MENKYPLKREFSPISDNFEGFHDRGVAYTAGIAPRVCTLVLPVNTTERVSLGDAGPLEVGKSWIFRTDW